MIYICKVGAGILSRVDSSAVLHAQLPQVMQVHIASGPVSTKWGMQHL